MFLRQSAPRTLSRGEQSRLLREVAKRGTPRDHALLSLALATGLRLRELVGLNVGDVAPNGRQVDWKVVVPPHLAKNGRNGVVFLSPRIQRDLGRYLAWKRRSGESTALTAPLFLSNQGRRISLRRVQLIFAYWQGKAGFERLYNFHALRHTAITNVYRSTKDLYLAQRFARHSSPLTTTVYTHVSDEEMYGAMWECRP